VKVADRPMIEAAQSDRPFVILAVLLVAVACVASSGAYFLPGQWYAALAKPSWTPPAWVFPPVWSVLYLTIAVAGWLVWSLPHARALRAMWIVQLVLNGAWSWLFFGLHMTVYALLDLLLLVASVAALVVASWSRCRAVGIVLLPYLAWIAYAATLNAGVWWLNR